MTTLRSTLTGPEKGVLQFARQIGLSEAERLLRDELHRRQRPADEPAAGTHQRDLRPSAMGSSGYVTKA